MYLYFIKVTTHEENICAHFRAYLLAVIEHQLQKNEAETLNQSLPEEISKLKRFVAITQGISIDSVYYDPKTKLFTTWNKSFSESYEYIKKHYDNANEYKANYENNKN